MDERVLVTGGCGYVGSHAALRLRDEGYPVVLLDNLSRGHARVAIDLGLPLVEASVADTDVVRQTLREHRITAVMHFAAFAYVGESVQNPQLYWQNNVGGSLALMAACEAEGVRRLVFSSTCAVYGIPEVVPIAESCPMAPTHPYGRSKLVIEQALADYARTGGWQVTALRYFNAAGADPDARVGEDHTPETHLIPNVLGAARGEGDLVIHGTDYDTPDGSCIRDYVHVNDLADAHIRALERMKEGSPGYEAYNLGTGQGVSVKEIIAAAAEITGKPIPYAVGPRREGDPPKLTAAAGRAREHLGWKPQRSELINILEDALRWHRRNEVSIH